MRALELVGWWSWSRGAGSVVLETCLEIHLDKGCLKNPPFNVFWVCLDEFKRSIWKSGINHCTYIETIIWGHMDNVMGTYCGVPCQRGVLLKNGEH
jgi:hypothetical protein